MAGTAKKNTSNMYRFIAENIIQKRTQWVFFVIFHWLWHGLAWPVRPSAQRQEVCLDFAAGRGRSSCISERFGAKVVINGDNVVRCLKYIHTYMHVYIVIYIYIYDLFLYMYMCVCARVRVCVCVCACACVCACVCVCKSLWWVFGPCFTERSTRWVSNIHIYNYI